MRPTNLHRPYIDELTRPNPDDPTGRSHDAAHPRRARRVVRLGLDAVRPGALSVRERGLVRQPLSRRLHRRVHRPDPRLVLHAARAGHRAVRPAGVQNLCGARHRAGLRRPEDEQVAAQLPGRHRGVRPRRLRRHAVVPDGLADPARRQPDRHRAGHPRRRAAGAAAVVERLHLPGALRAESGHLAHRLDARAGPLHPGQAGRAARRPHRVDGRLRHLRGLRAAAPVHRGADELVCATVAFAVLGGRRRRHRHPAHRAGGDRAAGRSAAAVGNRDHLARV